MTTPDAPLLELTANVPPRPLAPAILAARTEILAAIADLAALSDAALENEWSWTSKGKVELRYALYRAYEILEQATANAEAAFAEGPPRSGAARLIGPATAARWDLNGLLHGLTDADWDTEPGKAEWTIRLTLGHVISGQRAYGWGTAWWLNQGARLDDPGLVPRVPDEFWTDLPDEATDEVAGTPKDLIARLDAILDLSTERLAGLPATALALGSGWAGFPVSIGFRLGRWSSHIREHTIQVEKTLTMLGHQPTEVARLVRLVLAAYGRLEAVVFGLPADAKQATASAIVAQAVADVREVAGSAHSDRPIS